MSDAQCTFLSASQVGQSSTGQSAGMTRKAALTGVSDQICSSVMEAEPRSASAVHHHGSQDTIVYGLQGHGSVLFDRGNKKHNIGPGDWCLIPAQCEHQEVNEGDEKVVWLIHRGGSEPQVHNLDGWSQT